MKNRRRIRPILIHKSRTIVVTDYRAQDLEKHTSRGYKVVERGENYAVLRKEWSVHKPEKGK